MSNPSISPIRRSLRSFTFAFAGLRFLLKNEVNSRIHLLMTILVIGAGFYFQIGLLKWSIIILCIAMVFTAELFNTAIEKTIDYISAEKHPAAGAIKDLSAAAVLVAAVASLVTGIIIFLPYMPGLFRAAP